MNSRGKAGADAPATSAAADGRPPLPLAWIVAVLLMVVVAAYQPVWTADFVWDDDAHRTRPELQSGEGLWQIWADLDATQQYYPLVHSLFWVQHRLWGDNPLGYHLVNVGLHAINAMLVLLVLRRLRLRGATWAAFVFAVHPVMVESVAWISELKNTFSGLCYLAAVLVYLRFDQDRQPRRYLAALGLFVLGLLSKTVVATLPGALLVVFWWQRGRLEWRRDAWPLVPFFVLGIVAGLFTALVERQLIGAKGPDFEFTLVERGLIAGRVVWFYLGKLLWPATLSFVYPRWEISQTVWWQYAYPLATLGALAVAWHYRHRTRGPLAAMLFFGGTLVPVLGFVNVYPFVFSFVADHFQYLASLGAISLVAACAAAVTERLGPMRMIVGALSIGLLGILTWQQACLYHDRETLWRDTLKKNPDCWLAHNNLGRLLINQDRVEESMSHFMAAMRVRPDEMEVLNNVGIAFARSGTPGKALPYFEKALESEPDSALTHYNLALALANDGRVKDAIPHFEKALREDPNYVDAHYQFGLILFKEDRLPEATVHLQQVITLEPDHARAYQLLGHVNQELKQFDQAALLFEKAVALQPEKETFLNDLAWLRATAPDSALRDAMAAVRFAERAVALSQRKDPGILDTLAAAHAEAGRWAEAVTIAEEALDLARANANERLVAEIELRLDGYRRSQPWRYAPGSSPEQTED